MHVLVKVLRCSMPCAALGWARQHILLSSPRFRHYILYRLTYADHSWEPVFLLYQKKAKARSATPAM